MGATMIGAMPLCMACKWFDRAKTGFKCAAYPDGIPREILDGDRHQQLRGDETGKKVFYELEPGKEDIEAGAGVSDRRVKLHFIGLDTTDSEIDAVLEDFGWK